ncbi:unnamed protein product [Darwinula stevensoni]|uniref:Bestrophin homolog n=1 Tax=Darwinula stevensoni TaxID=69355 RepID=A0A7R9FR38_9CRUS|nr:unnamed protein product [Darwinula stevensoni]CAG0900575.1 unnamed protein product [Darwinula stevensoni]
MLQKRLDSQIVRERKTAPPRLSPPVNPTVALTPCIDAKRARAKGGSPRKSIAVDTAPLPPHTTESRGDEKPQRSERRGGRFPLPSRIMKAYESAPKFANGARIGGIIGIVLRWKMSIYKLIWFELFFWLVFFYGFNMLYTYGLDPGQKKSFETVVTYCRDFNKTIPLLFVLGFYVTTVFTRWWGMWNSLPWPDEFIHYLTLYLHGKADPVNPVNPVPGNSSETDERIITSEVSIESLGPGGDTRWVKSPKRSLRTLLPCVLLSVSASEECTGRLIRVETRSVRFDSWPAPDAELGHRRSFSDRSRGSCGADMAVSDDVFAPRVGP